jgi:arylsulfatase
MSQQPNILWICTDQQRFDTLGCMGNRFVNTPNLDALASGGVLFEHAYCQNPVCSPSRASFLTGRYPRTTGVTQNGQSIPDREVLVTKRLSDAGYVCGLSGKLHISSVYPSESPGTERRIDDGYDEFHWMHHPWGDWPTNEYQNWLGERGATYTDQQHPDSPHVRYGMDEAHHPTTWCAEKAISFMERCAEYDSPWLFSVNIFDPHHIFDPPREYLERYLDRLDEIPLPNCTPGELDDKPQFQQRDHTTKFDEKSFDEMSDECHRLSIAAYWAMCDLIDVQVGRLLDTLDRTGQRDNTVVVFTSDHGEMLGDHGIYYKGPYCYDPAIRVPLIISTRNSPLKGPDPFIGRSGALVELVDIAPTLLEAAGLEIPVGMQGRSLWPMLTGQADPQHHRDDVYCESYEISDDGKPAATVTMVRTPACKLSAVHGRDEGELYDLAADPAETHNLWASAQHQQLKIAMLKRLGDRMAFTMDPLPYRANGW